MSNSSAASVLTDRHVDGRTHRRDRFYTPDWWCGKECTGNWLGLLKQFFRFRFKKITVDSDSSQSDLVSDLRGHLGVPDSVSEPLIVPLNYLVILHLILLKKCTGLGDSKHMTLEIECFHRYWNSASRTPRFPLNVPRFALLSTSAQFCSMQLTWELTGLNVRSNAH